MTSLRYVATMYYEIFLYTNWTRYIRHFNFVFELCCLCKGFSVIFKRHIQKLALPKQKEI